MENWIGKTLYGYCNGAFGRESYTDKIIEAIGKDWIVAREQSFGEVLIVQFSPENNQSVQETMLKYLEIWSKE